MKARAAASGPGRGAADAAARRRGLAALARATGLVHVDDRTPGLRRERRGRAFAYRRARGAPVRDAATLARIRALAIPPAWEDVWICASPRGHLQATGRDARGRKQYRYHPAFRASREAGKFDALAAFGRALPKLRARVAADLRAAQRAAAPTQDGVLAAIVRLLDTTFVRIGNDEYARANGSYGLTTLRRRHAGVERGVLRLSFRGKSGRRHEVSLADARVARIVRRCQQLPGQELFSYVDADGRVRSVGSGDVNDYLERATGERCTAKEFRTWHGSVQALARWCEVCDAQAPAREAGAAPGRSAPAVAPPAFGAVIAEVAQLLGNTAAVCRKAYIHPAVLALGEQGVAGPDGAAVRRRRGLGAAEARLLALLERRRTRRRDAA